MPPVRQDGFSAGELSRMLWGRYGVREYSLGLRRCRNFFVSKQGAAVSRPGTAFIARAKEGVDPGARLIPFVYSDDQGYALLFGHNYVRFIYQGAYVEDPGSPGNPLEVVTPYAADELFRIQYVQSGDVLFLTHPDHTQQTLSRLAHDDWAIAALDVVPPTVGWQADIDVGGWPVADATHPGIQWAYRTTTLLRLANGTVVESMPDALISPEPATVVVYKDKPVKLKFDAVGLLGTVPEGAAVIGSRVYRGRDTTFGFIGELRNGYVTSYFSDYGQEPDYSLQPPKGHNPFEVMNDQGTAVDHTEEPIALTFYEDRLVFGGTVERPEHIVASATGDYTNFDEVHPTTDDVSLDFDLGARTRQEIRHLVPKGRLLALTNAAVWSISGPGGEALSAAELIDGRENVGIGSSWLRPLDVGNEVLYARVKGTGIRDLAFSNDAGQFVSSDISAHAEHLFTKRNVVDWAFAEDPWGLAWAVRNDGTLLSLTYVRERNAIAWARHDSNGTFKSVCAVPETTEDGVYLVVVRPASGGDVWCVERMTDRVIAEDDDENVTTATSAVVSVDAAVTQLGSNIITGLDHLEGLLVAVVADGVDRGDVAVVGGQVAVPAGLVPTVAHAGLRFTPQLGLLDLGQDPLRIKTVRKVAFHMQASDGVSAGEDFDTLTPWAPSTDPDAAGAYPIATALASVAIEHTWNEGGRAVLEVTKALPVTVYGIIREVEDGGKR